VALMSRVIITDGAPKPQDSRSANKPSPGGSVLAFDFGARRIGVAVGDLSLKIAHPLETIDSTEPELQFGRIATLIAEWRPARVVVGLPVASDGSEHALAAAVHAFCKELERRFSVPVACVDERYTSAEAGSMLREIGVRGRGQKRHLDQVAAKTILDDFFAHHDDTDA
jgi:putative Holliday junction resolvase